MGRRLEVPRAKETSCLFSFQELSWKPPYALSYDREGPGGLSMHSIVTQTTSEQVWESHGTNPMMSAFRMVCSEPICDAFFPPARILLDEVNVALVILGDLCYVSPCGRETVQDEGRGRISGRVVQGGLSSPRLLGRAAMPSMLAAILTQPALGPGAPPGGKKCAALALATWKSTPQFLRAPRHSLWR